MPDRMIITSERTVGTGAVKWPSKHILPVKLQTLEEDYSRYCVRFAGNGKYFKTIDEAAVYLKQRFNISLAKGEPNNERVRYQNAGWHDEKGACGY